jgi:uncharacterized membrane protein YgcG
VTKPVELLGEAHRRLALIAAARAAAYWLVPALAALALAGLFNLIGTATWGRFGYELAGDYGVALPVAMLAAGIAMLAAGAIRGWLAWRRTDFVAAAGQVDDAVGGHQEVLTLAALSDPQHPAAAERGALFPLLWHRVSTLLASFDPARAFGFELGAALGRSSIFTAAAIVLVALATLAMVRRVTPDQLAARKLVELAREISNTATGNGPAQEIIAATERVESSKLPTEQKLQQLADLTNQLKQQQQQPQPPKEKQSPPPGKTPKNQSAKNQSGKSTSGSGSANGEAKHAEGNGNGGGGKSQGAGKGSGSGSGTGKGSGNDQNSQQNANASPKQGQNQKTNQQLAKLQDEIAKAQAQLQAGHAKNPGPKNQPGGKEPGTGYKPDQTGNKRLASADHNGKGDKLNQPGAGGDQKPNGPKPGDKNGTTPGGTNGDTHLGEFPAPVAYQRFYQPGEHGPKLAISDARYVLFRLPEAIAASSAKGGKLMLDTSGPRATTPYVNVPLNESRPLEVAPNEQQLVPPRYRDLIR